MPTLATLQAFAHEILRAGRRNPGKQQPTDRRPRRAGGKGASHAGVGGGGCDHAAGAPVSRWRPQRDLLAVRVYAEGRLEAGDGRDGAADLARRAIGRGAIFLRSKADGGLMRRLPPPRHARARPGHPRRCDIFARKTWMAGTSPAMTAIDEIRLGS